MQCHWDLGEIPNPFSCGAGAYLAPKASSVIIVQTAACEDGLQQVECCIIKKKVNSKQNRYRDIFCQVCFDICYV